MSALGVPGDPGGWQQASDTIAAAVRQLTDELDAADAQGGSGLRKAWYGPVADAHQELWSKRYGRYADLLSQVGRAAGALADFAGRLWNFQVQAARLESQWLSLGLHLTVDGMSFTLPWGWENLAHEIQNLLHARLAEAVREVEAMWEDIGGAVADLVTIAQSVIDVIEDFDAIEVNVTLAAVGWTVKGMVGGYIKNPLSLGHDILETEADIFKREADLGKRLSEDGAHDVETAGNSVLSDAESSDTAKAVAGSFDHFAKVGGRVLMAGAVVVTLGQTYLTARKSGWVDAIEERAGDWASLGAGAAIGAAVGGIATGALVAVGAPVALAAIGVAVGVGVVAMGVGDVTQWYVDGHRKQVDHALTDIGHGIEDAAIWGAEETGLTPQSAT